jgi:hypothetical protein
MLIGIDFDNTLVTYDEVLREAALARALIDTDFAGTKQEIRDRIGVLPDGAEALLQQPSDDRPRQLHEWFSRAGNRNRSCSISKAEKRLEGNQSQFSKSRHREP